MIHVVFATGRDTRRRGKPSAVRRVSHTQLAKMSFDDIFEIHHSCFIRSISSFIIINNSNKRGCDPFYLCCRTFARSQTVTRCGMIHVEVFLDVDVAVELCYICFFFRLLVCVHTSVVLRRRGTLPAGTVRPPSGAINSSSR